MKYFVAFAVSMAVISVVADIAFRYEIKKYKDFYNVCNFLAVFQLILGLLFNAVVVALTDDRKRI